jgi:long-chain acyl-CoA synthetase
MFVRMLKLDEATRSKYDVSSLQAAIHAAAPCPIPVKHQMIQWWGPKIFEYYAGTEGNGFCSVTSAEWLAHEGTVGKPLLGELHICDEEGNELPTGEAGTTTTPRKLPRRGTPRAGARLATLGTSMPTGSCS